MHWFGIDVGGTFTDLVCYDPESGKIDLRKTPTTPHNHAEGIMAGIRKFGISLSEVEKIAHGTTVATNTALEKNGARTAVLMTAGFGDMFEFGRGERRSLYDFKYTRPAPLVHRSLVFEIGERMLHDGTPQTALDEARVEEVADELAALDVEAVAICFLHAYANPAHEERVKAILTSRLPDLFISCSSEVSSEVGEFERFATTLLNVYVAPRMGRYLHSVGNSLKEMGHKREIAIMTSSGGTASIGRISQLPVLSMLSGPASGVIGAAHVGELTGYSDLITYDMGGTSTDTCLISDLEWPMTSDGQIGALPNRVQQIEINSIGAGGGSIASIGPAGYLSVGPESAGARPGPACYGKGGIAPTVTDANVVLGRLGADRLLGDEISIDRAVAEKVVGELGGRLGLGTLDMADGIIRLAVTQMTGAIKEISIMRGYDPRRFVLLAYGGAGPLHAAFIAAEMGMRKVIVPRLPSNFSAFGVLTAEVRQEYALVKRFMTDQLDIAAFHAEFAGLREQGERGLLEENVKPEDMRFEARVDMRYRGQAFSLSVPIWLNEASIENVEKRFAEIYRKRYMNDWSGPIEIVSFRLSAIGLVAKPDLTIRLASAVGVEEARIGERKVYFGSGFVDTPVYNRDLLPETTSINGPALIEESGTTTVVPPGFRCSRDEFGNLILEQE